MPGLKPRGSGRPPHLSPGVPVRRRRSPASGGSRRRATRASPRSRRFLLSRRPSTGSLRVGAPRSDRLDSTPPPPFASAVPVLTKVDVQTQKVREFFPGGGSTLGFLPDSGRVQCALKSEVRENVPHFACYSPGPAEPEGEE